MKLPIALPCLFAATYCAYAAPGTSTLTLVNEAGFNTLDINLTINAPIASSSDTTDLSGTIQVALEIDPDTDQVSEMTIINGTVTGTPISLSGGGAAGSYSFSSNTLGGILSTPNPPGIVDPPTGDFDASQHAFEINQGVLSGTFTPFVGNPTNLSFDFGSSSVTGAGSGTGNVALTPTGSTPTSKTYDVVVTLPLSVTDTFDVITGLVTATVNVTGITKAAGTVTIDVTPENPYIAWTIANGIEGAAFDGDENGDGVDNGFLWALGLGATDSPFPHLLMPSGPKTFTMTLPAGGSAADILIQTGSDLTGWSDLDGAAMSTDNPIPAGTTGTVTITLPDSPNPVFVRGIATAP